MGTPRALTRREFLTGSAALISTLGTLPGFLSRSGLALADTTMRLSSRPGVPEDHVLVVVQLSGGNDGLNTVVPVGESAYYRARPKLAVPQDQAIILDDRRGIGLHPAMRPVAELVQRQAASIVQGVGYPNPNRSHFASMDIWHAGDTRGFRGSGWLGRALDAQAQQAGVDPLAAVSVGDQASPATVGRDVKPLAFEDPARYRWVGRDMGEDLASLYDQLHAGPGPDAADADGTAAFVYRTACDAQVASAKLRRAVAGRSQTRFPGGGLARQLEMVAKMIRAELPTRVYYVAMGGFDTHANQAGQHARLLGQFARAVAAFHAELEAIGHAQRVVTLAFSEFGRRVAQNASGGTDHGTAGPVFLFGPRVRPGLLGQAPTFKRLNDGDLLHTADFRSVYAGVLEQWMKLDPEPAVGRGFPPAKLFTV